MSDRFCRQCNTQVEDVGGFCLLGHSLREVAPTASLKELRAEVDRAFEEASVQVAHALTEAPPPPPPQVTSVFQIDIDEVTRDSDPIAEFAPAPRMDWGPDKENRLRRRFSH